MDMAEHAFRRDDFVGGRTGIHLPDIDISGAISKVEWPKLDLSSIDVGKAVRGAGAAAHIGRRRNRPRWRLAIGGLTFAVLASWVILRNDGVRARLTDGASAIRERIAAMKRSGYDQDEIDDPIAFDAAATAPIEASAFKVSRTTEATGYPAGLGSNDGGANPSFEATAAEPDQTSEGVLPRSKSHG
jgi:hypothetical protein